MRGSTQTGLRDIPEFQVTLFGMCTDSRAPYFFDSKPQLIKLFSIISCRLYDQGLLTFFFFTFSNSIDDAQYFLGYVLLTKMSSYSIHFSITCTSIIGEIIIYRRQLYGVGNITRVAN